MLPFLFGSYGYFNPRSPRGERPIIRKTVKPIMNFNPRSPRGERPPQNIWIPWGRKFQSTLPSRGATFCCFEVLQKTLDFNPRSPRGERLAAQLAHSRFSSISIHAPLAGSDSDNYQKIFLELSKMHKFFVGIFPLGASGSGNGRRCPLFCRKIWCEGSGEFLRTRASHHKISVSSGRYASARPKCSIFFSYWLPR